VTTRVNMVHRSQPIDGRAPKPMKIVVTGPFSAGKTTLIKTISEVAVVGTESEVSDASRSQKNKTTVAMDYGRVTFAEDLALYLFGTPGQRRFEVMWEILSEGMIGFVLLVNLLDERSLQESAHILEQFQRYADVPFVVGVTHVDEMEADTTGFEAHVRSVLDLPEGIVVTPCDPRSREDVKSLMLEILLGVLRRLEGSHSDD